jgi:hypothetical protein
VNNCAAATNFYLQMLGLFSAVVLGKFGSAPVTNYVLRSSDEFQPSFRPGSEPELGYASSGADGGRLALYDLRPKFIFI